MAQNNIIFDRKLLLQRRSNIATSLGQADFLIKRSLVDILERLDHISISFPNILNLGSRTGYGSNELSSRPNTIKVTDTDLSPELLQLNPNKSKLIIDEEQPFFQANQFDLIISILNLHLVNDLPGALIQLKNALKPNGLLIASIFGENNLPQLRNSLLKTEAKIFSGISPRTIPMVELTQLGGLLQRAGFNMPVVDLDHVEVHYKKPLDLLHDLQNMGEANIMINRNKKYVGKKFWERFCENYIADYSSNNNEIIATFEILTLTGTKPQ